MIRTFIGVELEGAVIATLGEELAYLKRTHPAVRWLLPAQLHMTLKFIGPVPTAEIGEVFAAATLAAGEVEPFTLELRDLGCFPSPERPRIVWAGCSLGSDQVTHLARVVENACAEIGYEPEKHPFRPHISLGRIRHPRDGADLPPTLADARGTVFGCTEVEHLTVFMSTLKRKGAEYTPMQRIPLGGAPLCGDPPSALATR